MSYFAINLTCQPQHVSWFSHPFLVALSTLVLAPVAQADGLLRIATRDAIEPYVSEGAKSGIEIDLLNQIFAKMQVEVRYVQLPRIRMVQSFDNKIMDGILTQNVKASNVGCATDWYLKHQNVALSLTERNVKIDTFADIQPLSVISFDGATIYLGKKYKQAVSAAHRYTESVNQSSHIELLYKKRFDIAVGDEWILRLAQRTLFEVKNIHKPLTTHYIMDASLYSARFQDPALCIKFNEALAELRSTGAYANIVVSYHDNILVSDNSANNGPTPSKR